MIGVISNWPISRSKNSIAQIKACGRAVCYGRHIADGDFAFFTIWCPTGTSIETLVAVEGHRWAIEDSFETAKNEFGLDHSEIRSKHGWHRYVSLAMLAFAMMAAIRHRANPPPKKRTAARRQKPKRATPSLIRWSIQEIRRIAVRLARKRIQPALIIAWSSWRRAHKLPLNALTLARGA